ncbi:MAG: hypothetical protein ACRDKS_14680, partial [Actinomycetota bacterium]
MTLRRRFLVAVCSAAIAIATVPASPAQAPAVATGPVPRAVCGPGSAPETGRQGRVPAVEIQSGRAMQGYTCNTAEVSH